MANFVRSFNRKVTQLFRSRAIPRRTREKSPSLLQRFWRTIPSYLPFYILVPVLAYALWYGRQPATVIAPFHLPPENKEQPLPFSGEAVADALQDAIMSIRQEAEGQPLTPPCDLLVQEEEESFFGLRAAGGGSFQVRGPVTVEVKGISPEALVSAAREVLGKERYISGDVVLRAPSSFQLMARANDHGPWMTKPREVSLPALQYASCELAERILGATNKNVLAAAWIRRGKYDDVIEQLYKGLPDKDGDPDALNNLGLALRMKCMAGSGKTCRIEDAVARFRQAITARWWFPEAHYNLGVALGYDKKFREAAAEYQTAIRLKPDYAVAYHNLGTVLLEEGRTDAAIREFRAALAVDPEDISARIFGHSNLGRALEDKEKYDDAIAECRKAIELKFDSPDAHRNLGNALKRKGQNEEATDEYREAIAEYLAIELKHDNSDTHLNLGILYAGKGETHDAIAEYRSAIKLKPDPDAHLLLGAALAGEKPDDAIAEYSKAIELKPNYPNAHNALGNALLAKQPYQAIAEYSKAIELDPDYADAHYGLGNALEKKGQTDKAIAEYRKAIELKPRFAAAHFNLGVALRQNGKTNEVIAECHQAIDGYLEILAAKPNDTEVLTSLAYAHYNLGVVLLDNRKVDEAIAEYRRAIELKPDYAIARENLAKALARKNQ